MRVVELFCGIGGFRYGLEKANQEVGECQSEQAWSVGGGSSPKRDIPSTSSRRQKPKQKQGHRLWGECQDFRCVWANDNDKYACQIYRKRFGDKELHEGDIRSVDAATIPEHDLLTAGFPCQSFSIAGKRRGFEDTRGTLFFEICRVLRAKRTKYVLLENVKGLLSHDDGTTFQTIIRALDELGYDCQWQVLNSKDYGVPQNRERVFIIGYLRGQPRPKVFPIGEELQEVNQEECERSVSGTLSIKNQSGQAQWDGSTTLIIQAGHRAKGKLRYYKDEIPAMTQDYGTGGGNVQMVAKRQPLRYLDRNQKNIEGDYGFALDGSQTWGIKEGMKIRRLTPLECERLQGFPDNWTKSGTDKNGKDIEISDTQRYKCSGNAVTTNVITVIGRRLFKL